MPGTYLPADFWDGKVPSVQLHCRMSQMQALWDTEKKGFVLREQ